jgi:hypothetical protein
MPVEEKIAWNRVALPKVILGKKRRESGIPRRFRLNHAIFVSNRFFVSSKT